MKKTKSIFFLVLISSVSFLTIEALLRGAYEVREVFRTVISSDFYRNNLQKKSDIKQGSVVYDANEKPRPPGIGYKNEFYQYSTFLGYVPKKNSSGTGYHINRYHLRYDDFPEEKEANEIRIFVTGASVAWGHGVSQSDTYAYVLEKSLSAQYPKLKIRVIIAAVGMYVSTQERIFFENIVLPLNPDIVMMFSGWNDTYQGYRGTNIMHEHDFWGIKKLIQGKIKKMPVEKSDINYFVDPPHYEDYISKILLFYDKFLYARKFPNKASMQKVISELSVEPKSVYNSLKHNVQIIKTLCDSIGSKFIFYLQPSLFATEKKKLTKNEKTQLKSFSEYFVGFEDYHSKLYQTFKKLLPIDALNNGYVFADGDEAIKFEEKTVFSDEAHVDDRGHRLFAEHMFKILNPLVDEIAAKRTVAQH